jgi:hypothetical protein
VAGLPVSVHRVSDLFIVPSLQLGRLFWASASGSIRARRFADATPRTAQIAMPAFAWRLSYQDVADLVNFIRSSWGNSASAASAGDVAGVRKAVAPSAER